MSILRAWRRSFAVRIAVLAFTSGLGALFGLVLIVGALSTAPTTLKTVPLLGVIVGLPLLLGWLAARLVMRPLRSVARAITALQANRYETTIPESGIAEFDRVLRSFNILALRLRREEALRKDLIADASHELYTPLAALTGQLTAMQEGKLPPTPERLALVNGQIARLTELVSGLDAYARARVPRTNRAEPLAIAPLCARVVAELAPELVGRSVQTELAIPAALLIRAEQQACEQILHNLFQNALRHSGATAVRVVANQGGLTVADNGRGVPEDSLPYLFERFYRVEQSRNRATGGLGLGLAITKELVERQGWTIRAENARPGLALHIRFHD
jgi:signal transduction histidine kinase